MSRIKTLLLKCAANLENGCEPLHHEFLVENQISSDECFTLSEQMAVAIKGYARLSHEKAALVVLAATIDDEAQRNFLIAKLEQSSSMKKALEGFQKAAAW